MLIPAAMTGPWQVFHYELFIAHAWLPSRVRVWCRIPLIAFALAGRAFAGDLLIAREGRFRRGPGPEGPFSGWHKGKRFDSE